MTTESRADHALPITIVSGGQTGADRAALDWAIERAIEHGGWCPRGRRAEDGVIAARYRLRETPSDRYEQRTQWNVRDSDGTVILTLAPTLTGGSRTTAEWAESLGRPCLHVSREADGVRVLNVAGPRASGEPDVGAFVRWTLDRALGTR